LKGVVEVPLEILESDVERTEAYIATLNERLRELAREKAKAHDGGDVFHDPIFKELSQQERAIIIQKDEMVQKLKLAKVVSYNPMPYITLGKYVTIRFDSGDEDKIWLVGIAIGDPPEGYEMVSTESPLGQALMGKAFGQEAEYAVGERQIKVQVVKIRTTP